MVLLKIKQLLDRRREKKEKKEGQTCSVIKENFYSSYFHVRKTEGEEMH